MRSKEEIRNEIGYLEKMGCSGDKIHALRWVLGEELDIDKEMPRLPLECLTPFKEFKRFGKRRPAPYPPGRK